MTSTAPTGRTARTAGVLATLRDWRPADPGQEALRGQYLALVERLGDDALRKAGGPEHLTASTFILSTDLTHVLLALHRKARAWLQVGGHVEDDDADLAAAARREALEESGLADVTLWREQPVELDRHALGARFACRAHWDVGFVALAGRDEPIAVSDESDDVAWWPLDALPANSPPDLPIRLGRAVAAVRAG